jgi:hypothetical protein
MVDFATVASQNGLVLVSFLFNKKTNIIKKKAKTLGFENLNCYHM